MRKQLNRIPIASTYSEPYVDKWGREQIDTANVVARLFKNFLSPGYTSMKKVTEVDAEVLRLYALSDDSAVLPRSSTGNVDGNDGEKFYLQAGELTTYQKTMGQTAFDLLDALTTNTAHAKLSDDQQQSAVVDVYDHATQVAKVEFFDGRNLSYSPPEWFSREQEAVKAGVPLELFLSFKVATADMSADTDKDGKTISGSKKAKVEKYVNALNTTPKVRQH